MDSEAILILGGGIIGVSIAYHLALRGIKVTMVDRSGIASCASGKAGGLLVRDWNDQSAVGPLSRKSFDMHQKVASQFGLKSYRRLRCQQVEIEASHIPTSLEEAIANMVLGDLGLNTAETEEVNDRPDDSVSQLEWVDSGAIRAHQMGDESTVAQVHPKELVDAMWLFAEQIGSCFHQGVVEGLQMDQASPSLDDRRAVGAIIDGAVWPADTILLAMGPWGDVIGDILPGVDIVGVKYHSVVLESQSIFKEAVFFSGLGDPEAYPRNNGDMYLTGFPGPEAVVGELPGEVHICEETCARLVGTIKKLSSRLQRAEVTLKQACHLPFTRDHLPVMGRVPKYSNVYVATGHGCWGILNSLASGLAMAELIVDGEARSVDLTAFDPKRFT